jgi:hypothetical protein
VGYHTERIGSSSDTDSGRATADERLREIGEILATGLMRLRARKSSALLHTGADIFLGSLAHQSGAVAEIEGDTP